MSHHAYRVRVRKKKNIFGFNIFWGKSFHKKYGQICTKLHKKRLTDIIEMPNIFKQICFSQLRAAVDGSASLGPCLVLISPRGWHWFLHHLTQSSSLVKSVSQQKINPWRIIIPDVCQSLWPEAQGRADGQFSIDGRWLGGAGWNGGAMIEM